MGKIHKGDLVKIIAGNDKGKQGKVLSVFSKEGKIVVEGLNIKKKHVRPKRQGQKGELVRVPAPFAVSKSMLLCGRCVAPVRVGYKMAESGKKRRICKKCGSDL